ncbi:hypothetical protein K438DRAFT_1635008, partial [Mycena galopus ATCC 62051]
WLVPIAVLIVMSFPPLFGQEIVAMLCGVAWGLGKGFGIVAAGTILGEICTFFFFKFLCGARGRKAEATNKRYATLARVVREGGLVIPIIMCYSAMPTHFTTAVFATCGMKACPFISFLLKVADIVSDQFWVFLIAAVVSLPKQIAVVYIGVALNSSKSSNFFTNSNCPLNACTDDSKSQKVQKIVLAITIVIILLALGYIRILMDKAIPAVIYDRRKARQVKLLGER